MTLYIIYRNIRHKRGILYKTGATTVVSVRSAAVAYTVRRAAISSRTSLLATRAHKSPRRRVGGGRSVGGGDPPINIERLIYRFCRLPRNDLK